MKRIIIQYGGTGDLALKKLYPAYEHLLSKGHIFDVLALGRRHPDKEAFIKQTLDSETSKLLLQHIDYLFFDMAADEAVSILSKAR